MKYHRAWQEDRHFFTQMEVCERGSFGACLGKLRGWAEGTTTAAGDRYGQTDWSTSIHSSSSSAKTFDDGNETVPTTHLLAERDVWRFARRLSLIPISEPTRLGSLSVAVLCLPPN